jgi:hypothetical protein
MLLWQRLAEQRVIGAKIINRNPALRHACCAAGLKYINRLICIRLRNPATHRTASQPLIFEGLKLFQILKRLNVRQRIELQTLFIFQPEGAARRLMEMPLHNLIGLRIERFASLLGGLSYVSRQFCLVRHQKNLMRREKTLAGRPLAECLSLNVARRSYQYPTRLWGTFLTA